MCCKKQANLLAWQGNGLAVNICCYWLLHPEEVFVTLLEVDLIFLFFNIHVLGTS